MRLIIGGAYQGKLQYAQKTYPEAEIIDNLHLQIRECVKEKVSKEKHLTAEDFASLQNELEQEWIGKLEEKIADNRDICIICAEVGMGIVPMEEWERIYREVTGHVCIWLTAHAGSVERIICGCAEKIK